MSQGQGQGQAEALFTPVKLSDPFGEYIKVACGGKTGKFYFGKFRICLAKIFRSVFWLRITNGLPPLSLRPLEANPRLRSGEIQ